MKFINNIIKIAHAPHAKVVNFKGCDGYWTKNKLGYNLFISAKDGKIWLPLPLRGQKPDAVPSERFVALSENDNGKQDYEEWLSHFRNQQESDKLHNGYEFTDKGKQLMGRIKNFLIKNNIDSSLVDKMLSHMDVEKVKQLAKNLAKKYRSHLETLRSQNNPDADRVDKEFFSNWNKLNPLFQYNPNDYNPHIDSVEEIKTQNLKDTFLDFAHSVAPFLDAQMSDIEEIIKVLNKAISDDKIEIARRTWNLLHSTIVSNLNNHYFHIIGKNSARILELPQYIALQKQLFDGVDTV